MSLASEVDELATRVGQEIKTVRTEIAAAVNATSVEAAGAVMATGTANKMHGPITQAAYDALTPDADTWYLIVG